jgi:RNA polymerase sigma-70 factor (ECF subfamily)
VSLDIADGQIQGIRSIVNPDKLRHLGPVSEVLTPPAPRRSSRPS